MAIIPFSIYNASAGSGKTFTLVKEYLKKIISAKREDYYKNLLAITFTNKAVAEMKQRIIENLVSFSEEGVLNKPPLMLEKIAEETNLSIPYIHQQSKKIVRHLLHHYAGFSVETIDHFNHRLIRTFAKDLKLPSNFEVSLDAPQLLAEAVDKLITKAGEDPEITKVLLDFALHKTDDDKSWDISKDLLNTASLLLNENDAPHVAKLRDKSLQDFETFKKTLRKEKKGLTESVIQKASEMLQIFEERGLVQEDFSGKYLFIHFNNLSIGRFDINFNAGWQLTLEEKPLYPARVKKETPVLASIMDDLAPAISLNFQQTKKEVFRILLVESVLKNLTPLSVINLVSKELEIIKEEKNVLPISEFNQLIYNEIKDQPAPFIYERLGERYRHFFIDEFQDTSLLQWKNLVPLADNALSQQFEDGQQGSILLVGDAKQSIYRWRGGLPEQFISLYTIENPFSISEKEIHNLETNYRSCKNIIDFNNAFFSFTANHFGNILHKELYKIGNTQKTNQKQEGYVNFEFIEAENKAEAHEIYAVSVYETILKLKENGFNESDICILTRAKSEGISLGKYLMEKEIPIISSETLLLQHSSIVQCLLNAITLSLYPENEEVKIAVLEFLYSHFKISEEKHGFFATLLKVPFGIFSESLKNYEIEFNFDLLRSISLYESCEYLIRHFKLEEKADAYLFAFMDLVYEFEQKPNSGKIEFLEYWENKKNSASIPASEGINAVQMMTIHKAKGLEFPVVLFPYADVDLYKEQNATTWYPWDDKTSHFDEVLINYKNEVAEYGTAGAEIYEERRNTLEMDNINLLYVTLTRAVQQLYVFSEKPKALKNESPNSFNQLFRVFLEASGKWDETQLIYEFGNFDKNCMESKLEKVAQFIPEYITTRLPEHNLHIVSAEAFLWQTQAEEAIAGGNLLHDTMAKIKNIENFDEVFEEMESRSTVSKEEIGSLKKLISNIITHADLKHLFEISAKVITERDIITARGEILRPDRLNFHPDKSVSIIDYKTGIPKIQHKDQINSYANAMEEMGYAVTEKIVIYSTGEEIVINKV